MFKMERHIKRQDSDLQFNRNFPGCFWSILHTLDYHHWHNVKKMLPYRKHSRSKGGIKTTVNNQHIAREPENSNDGSEPLLCSTESVPADKRSGEAHVSLLITEDMSEEESQKDWKLNFKSKRRLLRTYSIHHLGHSHNFPSNTSEIGDSTVPSSRNNENDTVAVGTSRQKSLKKLAASGKRFNWLDAMNSKDNYGHRKNDIQSTPFAENINEVKETSKANQIERDISSPEVDILELFKANKKLFAELLQGADSDHYFQGLPNKTSAGLAKSRSFPTAGLARNRLRRLSSLQHKQTESFPKGQKSVSGPQPSKLVESESPENSHIKMTSYDSGDDTEPQIKSSSLGPIHGSKHGGWNQLVIKRLNFVKHKIRHAFRERKKRSNQKSAKGMSSTVQSGHDLLLDGQDTEECLGINTSKDGVGINDYNETESSKCDNVSGVKTMSRIASLNASLERYAQLYENSSNRNGETNQSQSLKLTSEDRGLKSASSKKSFKRNLSMPDLELFCSLFNGPPHEGLHTIQPPRTSVDINTDNSIHRHPNSDCLLTGLDRSDPPDIESKNMIEKDELIMPTDYSGCLNVVENDQATAQPDEVEDIMSDPDSLGSEDDLVPDDDCRFEDVLELSLHGQTLDLEVCIQDDGTCILKIPDSKGAELNPEFVNELEASDGLPNNSSTLPAFQTMVYHDMIDDIGKICDHRGLYSESNGINNADFNYMRYILQVSSFIENGNTTEQPPNSLIFDGQEARFYKKLECYWKSVEKNSDHQLLLDLVSETLHTVFERSLICFLKAFSLKCQIKPMPLGQYLIDEVREKVSWYLCLGPELDQSLDDVVGRDLGKGDDWMNLQSETEGLALELEDLILDELLDEVIYS